MDAEPASAFEPRDKEVGALELGQHCGGAGAVERGVAELGGELAQDRGTVQKRPLVLVERRENLAAQVLGHEVVIASERLHGCGRVVDRPQPETGQDERRRPALGPLVEQFDLARPELDLPTGDQELVRLGAGERELPRAQLGEHPGGAVSREAQRRIDPRDENHTCVEWEVRQGMVDRRDAALAGHLVKIVEHQEQPLPERGDAVHELVDRVLDRTARYPSRCSAARPSPGRRDRPPRLHTATIELDRCRRYRG